MKRSERVFVHVLARHPLQNAKDIEADTGKAGGCVGGASELQEETVMVGMPRVALMYDSIDNVITHSGGPFLIQVQSGIPRSAHTAPGHSTIPD